MRFHPGVAAALLAAATAAAAMYAPLSESELAQSDVIALGEYVGDAALRTDPGAPPMRLGVIRVDEVLKGRHADGVVLLEVESPMPVRRSDTLTFRPGQKGLWYLKAKGGMPGVYLADHPLRFVPTDRAAAPAQKLRALRLKPIP